MSSKENTIDILALKEFFKRKAIKNLLEGDYDGFLINHFKSNYASMDYKYSIVDEDFNAFVQLAATNHPLKKYVESKRKSTKRNGRLKVGIILEGFSKFQAPIQQYRTLAKFNTRFNLHYYSRIPLTTETARKEHYAGVIEELKQYGCKVSYTLISRAPMDEIRFLADSILDDGIDILIYQTLYFIPQFNFLSHLWPAFFQCSTTHQQPEYCYHMDCVNTLKTFEPYQVVECNPYLLSMDKNQDEKRHSRDQFGIPEDAVIMVSCARENKYDKEFWETLDSIMFRFKNIVFFALGFSGEPPVSEESSKRIFSLGYREDVVAFYKMADIYFDMFQHTSGALMEAAYFGIPGVTKEREPMGLKFDVDHQDITLEFIPDRNLSLERLITDKEYRKVKGKEFQEFASQFEPKQAVDRFTKALEDKFQRKVERYERLFKMCV
jgi:hypothetical protein